ncbi:MAG: nitrilase family protein [Chitinophagaceae bacterium]|nr:nitrilase family protein [Chitinophagaceae bacterium]
MDQTLRITTIQSHLIWEDKAANLAMFEKKIMGIREKTEIVVLPEMFSTGFSMEPQRLAETMDGPSVQWMRRIASEKKIILTGSLIIADDTGDTPPRYYNRLIWMLPNGQYGFYDKRHRFAYAGEDKMFTSGNKRLIASVKGWKINLLICYDLRFPVWARQSTLSSASSNGACPEYDVLIYVANWPDKRSHAWRTLLQARAIENQCYTVGVNRIGSDGNQIQYIGDTMVVDPLGEVLYQKKEEDHVNTITLDKAHLNTIRERFPFWRDADYFQVLNEDLDETPES